MDHYIGTILPWPIAYAPEGWMLCDGAILNIVQYQALFSLIGNIYGGNGTTTFALPNLKGRVPVGAVPGPTSDYELGETGGVERVTLNLNEIPGHSHSINAKNASANIAAPAVNTVLAKAVDKDRNSVSMYSDAVADAAINPTGVVGGSQSHENRQPYIALNYIICINGIYPVRP